MGRLGCVLGLFGALAWAGVLEAHALEAGRVGAAGASIALPANWHTIRQSVQSSRTTR